MDDAVELPDDVDPELWFTSSNAECGGGRDYLYDSHWLTHPGRMAAFCPHNRDFPDYRISLSELPVDLPPATRQWVRGFLAGNLPGPPDAHWESEEMAAWRRSALEFSATGRWHVE